MKIKTTVQPINSYICEICDREYSDEGSAVWCEATHKKLTCKHTNLTYYTEVEDDYGDYNAYIYTSCKDCKKEEIEKYQFSHYLLSDEALKKVFDIIKQECEI